MKKSGENKRVLLPADCGPEIDYLFAGYRGLLTETEAAAYKRIIFEQRPTIAPAHWRR